MSGLCDCYLRLVCAHGPSARHARDQGHGASLYACSSIFERALVYQGCVTVMLGLSALMGPPHATLDIKGTVRLCMHALAYLSAHLYIRAVQLLS